MSSGFCVRTSATPYECMAQADLSYMNGDSLAPLGVDECGIVFKLHAYPVVRVGVDENHALLSYATAPVATTTFIELGVRPNGAAYAVIQDGTAVITPAGYVTLNDWIELSATYDSNTQELTLTLSGANYYSATSTGGSGTPQTAAGSGQTSRVMVLNGITGASRMDCSVKSAYVGWNSEGRVSWTVDRDGVFQPTLPANATSYTTSQVWALTPVWFQPIGNPLLYGAIPTEPTEPPLRVVVFTDYERIVRSTTYYRKVAA